MKCDSVVEGRTLLPNLRSVQLTIKYIIFHLVELMFVPRLTSIWRKDPFAGAISPICYANQLFFTNYFIYQNNNGGNDQTIRGRMALGNRWHFAMAVLFDSKTIVCFTFARADPHRAVFSPPFQITHIGHKRCVP